MGAFVGAAAGARSGKLRVAEGAQAPRGMEDYGNAGSQDRPDDFPGPVHDQDLSDLEVPVMAQSAWGQPPPGGGQGSRPRGGGVVSLHQARPANSRVSVLTFTFSPSLMKRGTLISMPVSRVAGLVTLPLAVSPRLPGSV